MNRKEFLSSLGLGAAAIAYISCFGGCKSADTGTNPPANVDFTLDLNDSANSALKTNGGYIYKNGIIIARTVGGTYVALSLVCTHAGGTVYYVSGTNHFYCPNHGSNFATDGSVVNGPATSPLTRYNTALSGTSLRIYS